MIGAFSRVFAPSRAVPPDLTEDELPHAALLVAAYNEEDVIAQRVRNALALDYPPEQLEIAIGSDGSSDRTVEIARSCANGRVNVLDYPRRRGKASVLNSAMQEVTAPIVILSDANTEIEAGAVRKLVRWFSDPNVGVVCGRLILTDPHTGKNVDSLYWKFETFLKRCESRLGALLGSNGAIYAIRRELYRPIPADTIVDDFVIPLLARLEHRCRILYDDDAIAKEQSPADVRSEFHRRARIGAGGFQSIVMLWRLLSPRTGWVAFAFLSHKVMRWLCPFFLLGALFTAGLLSGRILYRAAFAAQLLFYATSVAMAYVPARHRLLRPLRLTTMFSSMNVALLIGFARWVRGTQRGTWRRTGRVAEPVGAT
jgi:cellulose synthase/poly-beta-1,6-N-acetylglucosamine synthase-like glycosyltransferase